MLWICRYWPKAGYVWEPPPHRKKTWSERVRFTVFSWVLAQYVSFLVQSKNAGLDQLTPAAPSPPPLPWKDTSLSLTVFMLFSQASILWFKLIFFFGTFVANCCVSSDTLETRRWNWNHQWRCHRSCHSPWLCFCRSRLNWGFLEESDLTFWFSALYCGR